MIFIICRGGFLLLIIQVFFAHVKSSSTGFGYTADYDETFRICLVNKTFCLGKLAVGNNAQDNLFFIMGKASFDGLSLTNMD